LACYPVDMGDDPILAALARLETGLGAARADMTDLRADMTDLRADMTNLRADMTDLRADMTDLHADMTNLRTDMTNLRTDMTNLRVDFLEELGGTRGVLVARLDRLQARIDQLQEECFVAFAQGETVRRHSDNTRAETRGLAEEVSALVRQMRMLRTRIDGIEGS